MVKENNESNAVDSEMNSDVSAGCGKPFFFRRALVPGRIRKWCMLHKTICNDGFLHNSASTFNVCLCDF